MRSPAARRAFDHSRSSSVRTRSYSARKSRQALRSAGVNCVGGMTSKTSRSSKLIQWLLDGTPWHLRRIANPLHTSRSLVCSGESRGAKESMHWSSRCSAWARSCAPLASVARNAARNSAEVMPDVWSVVDATAASCRYWGACWSKNALCRVANSSYRICMPDACSGVAARRTSHPSRSWLVSTVHSGKLVSAYPTPSSTYARIVFGGTVCRRNANERIAIGRYCIVLPRNYGQEGPEGPV